MTGLLEGIRVLDFGRYIAGPYCASLLGDLGADVIRIERREGSEDRCIQPVVPGASLGKGGEGTMYMQINRNKRSITLDPLTDGGRTIVKKLVTNADVVVANLPPKTLEAMQLDYASLCATKADIILTTVSAFGNGGPYSDRVGFDGVAQAMCGAAYLTGGPEGPVKSYAPWVDFGTAALAAFGTMAALFEKQRSGRGQVVEGALLATALGFFNFHLIEQALAQTHREPVGNRSPYAGPVDILETSDGWVMVQVVGAPLFRRWAALMGEETWLTDPRFSDDLQRGKNAELLSNRMARWCAERTTREALDQMADARIPAGPVYKPQEVLDDPHIQAMQFMQPVSFPGMPGEAPLMRTPVRLSRTPGEIRHRAPLLGEHTEDILAEIGIDAKTREKLRRDHVI